MARTKLQTPNFRLGKRNDGYYDIRYEEDGKTKTKSTGSKDPVQAEAIRSRFAHDYIKPHAGPRPTITDVCDNYFAFKKDTLASPSAMKYAFDPLRRLVGHIFADAFTQSTVNTYIKLRLSERPVRAGGRYSDKPVNEATVGKELRMLRAALRWAASENLISKEPSFRVPLTTGATRSDWLTKAEANKLIENAAQHIGMFVLIAVVTAKRREAILSLTWDRVRLRVPGHELIDFGGDVGNKRRGLTPIAGSARLVNALRIEKEAREKTLGRELGQNDFVVNFKGEMVKDIKTALRAACRRAGMPEIGAHVLKHTAITWMVQSGMDTQRIADFTNTSKEMIERVYGHHSPVMQAQVAAAVAF